ncbi:MAG: Serine/threonine-protein kinase PknD [Nitrosomonas europaea]|uniref:serine/threonine-protein kinase n=1 Tax=Nitrosomonas TaxID=914 RepID=UPI0023EFC621|nr:MULTISPECIES: serine/threonine-protein kinase [Nitrosomonas]MBV6388436.1 Serine/threonine-protein kinase PknD [Nitrosomonas europaea]MEB2330968.1 serine/threonine-protein kinase [Nitrosomonas sp.]
MTSDPSFPDNDLTIVSPCTIVQSPRTIPTVSFDGNALPVGTVLEEFEITGIIGRGGFGIVYLAYDHSLQRQVALKEYMPAALAVRDQGITISIKSEQYQETFQTGLRSFINEARLLAQFDHPSLIKVYRFWESNGTAYMVMPFYQGITLKETLRAMHHPPDEAWLKHLLAQLLDALDILHKDHCFHRDIAPDNILILSDGHAVLLDFGAARRVISNMTQNLTVILKPGYAPVEQYAETTSVTQGPWTDMYALAAVTYFAITGKVPPPSVSRMIADTFIPLSQTTADRRYSADFLEGINRTLAVRPENRPQNIDELRILLDIPQRQTTAENKSATHTDKQLAGKRSKVLYPAAVFITLTAVISTVFILLNEKPHELPGSAPDTKIETAEPLDPVRVLDEIFDSRDRDHAVTISVRKAQVRINKDPLHFRILSTKSGYVYLLMVGTNHSDFFLLFPNLVDEDNYIEANKQFELPRPAWQMLATGPAGTNHFVVIVSSQPRDFSHTGLQITEPFAEFPHKQASERYRTHTGPIPLFAGKAICSPDITCSESYGAAVFSIEEIEA